MFNKQQRLVFKETVVRVLHQWGSGGVKHESLVYQQS